MDLSQLGTLVVAHKWIAVAAIIIGVIVRLLKSDTRLPTVPPRARIWLAIALGLVSGVLEKVASGITWTQAIVDGLTSTAVAVLSHEAIIASLRSGKELPVPGLIVPGERPAPTAPVTKDDS